jgi:hypothetical protein
MELWIRIIIYALLLLMFGFELWLSILNYKNRNAEIPDVVKDVYEESEYKKYQRYAMTNFKFGLIIKGVNLFVIIVLLATGFFNWLGEFINSVYEGYYMQILMFLLFYYIINFIVETIFSYIRTFKIEESYGFNKMTKITFLNDKLKSIILTVMFGGGLLYGLLWLHNSTNWMFFIYAWAALTVIIIIVNLIYTSVIVPLFNKLKPLEDSELKNKINEHENMIIKIKNKLNETYTSINDFKTSNIKLLEQLKYKLKDKLEELNQETNRILINLESNNYKLFLEKGFCYILNSDHNNIKKDDILEIKTANKILKVKVLCE